MILPVVLLLWEIENYYSRDAIQRILGDSYELPAEFQITDYSDIKEEIITHIIEPSSINFKAKNNFEVFEEMTQAEWITSSVVVEGTNDLQLIIDKILE